MNKTDCETISGQGRGRTDPRGKRRRRGSAGPRTVRAGAIRTGQIGLPSEGDHLLSRLAGPGAEARVNPTDSAMLIVRATRAGVSVGAGRFPVSLAQALVKQDLAEWAQRSAEPPTLRITDTGRARHRRRHAPPSVAFRHQHGPLVSVSIDTADGPARVHADGEESPLDWLRRRKDRRGAPLIDAAAYEAGQRLRADITPAGLPPGITSRWETQPGGPSSPAEATDRMIAARQRLRHAFQALGGDFSDLLIDLCGFLKGLELIERERGWPPRSAKVVVKLALSRLADHYGVESVARGPAAGRGIRAWQAVVIDGGLA